MDSKLQPMDPNAVPLDASGLFWAKLPRPKAASPGPKPPTLPSTRQPPPQAQSPTIQTPPGFPQPLGLFQTPIQPARPQPLLPKPMPGAMPPAPPPPPAAGLGPSPLPPSPLPAPPSPRAYHVRHGSPGDSGSDSNSSSYDSDGVQPEAQPTDPPAKHMTPARAAALGKLATDVIGDADKGVAALLLTVGDKCGARTIRSRVRRDAASAVARHLDVLREVGPLVRTPVPSARESPANPRGQLLKYIGYTPVPAAPRKTADGTATTAPADMADLGEFGLPGTAAAAYRLQIATPGEYLDWLATDLDMRRDATILLSLQTAALRLLLETLGQAYREGLNSHVHSVRVRALREALAWIDRTPVDAVLAKLRWPEQAGAGHLASFVGAARKLLPDGAKGTSLVHHHLSDLRAQNYPGIRMYQRSQQWVAAVLDAKEDEYFASLREKGWVMTQSDVDATVKKRLHGVRLGFKGAMNSRIGVVNKRLHGVRSKVDGVNTSLSKKIEGVNGTVTTKIDGVNSSLSKKIEGVNGTVTTKIDGVNSTLSEKIEGVNGTVTTKIDGVNSTLSEKIEGVNSTVTTKIDGVNSSLSEKIDGVHGTVTTKIDTVQSDVHNVKSEVDDVKCEVDDVKSDVDDVKSDMATLKAAIAAIAASQPENAALHLILSTFKH
ncbi:hypothetical protein DFH27DRAFT_641366 [Peziza echinospora]|nr:hypothetical protein DFH27DRAFT_641366 [Peziza echinospora]